jgi:hypothetical protein
MGFIFLFWQVANDVLDEYIFVHLDNNYKKFDLLMLATLALFSSLLHYLSQHHGVTSHFFHTFIFCW